MQVQKEEKREKILEVAKEEFMKHGYMDSSLRTIAKKSDMSVSNLYSYFANKNELFKVIVAPTVHKFNLILKRIENYSKSTNKSLLCKPPANKAMETMVEVIDRNRFYLTLLLFKSQGSEMEDFAENVIEKCTELFLDQNGVCSVCNQAVKPIEISDFFLHNISSFCVGIINEIVMHNISKDEMRLYFTEIFTFLNSGYKALLSDSSRC